MQIFGTLTSPTWIGLILAVVVYIIFVFGVTRDALSSIWFLLALGVAALFYHVTVALGLLVLFNAVVHHPGLTAGTVGLYAVIGVFVALLKWRTKCKVVLQSWHNANTAKANGDMREYAISRFKAIPKASAHKGDISYWIGTWPFILIDFAIVKVFRGFFTSIADLTEGIFNKVSFAVNADIVKEYEALPSEEEYALSKANMCKNAPKGWSCSRGKGHDGPCAASPIN